MLWRMSPARAWPVISGRRSGRPIEAACEQRATSLTVRSSPRADVEDRRRRPRARRGRGGRRGRRRGRGRSRGAAGRPRRPSAAGRWRCARRRSRGRRCRGWRAPGPARRCSRAAARRPPCRTGGSGSGSCVPARTCRWRRPSASVGRLRLGRRQRHAAGARRRRAGPSCRRALRPSRTTSSARAPSAVR